MGALVPKPAGEEYVEREAPVTGPSSLVVSDTVLGRGATGFALAATLNGTEVAVKVSLV
jgi:hypothetical protein